MDNIAKGMMAAIAAGAAAVVLAACGSTGAGQSTAVIAPAANTAHVSTAAPAPQTTTSTAPAAIDPDRDRGGDNPSNGGANPSNNGINDDKGHDVVDNDAHDDHGGDRSGHHDG